MALQKFLDNQTGLPTLWGLIKQYFVKQEPGKKLTTEDFTTDLKEKLEGIESSELQNQNAYSTVKVGETEIKADAVESTIELKQGTNVTLTGDAVGKTVTIAAKDTTYNEASGAEAGLLSTELYNKLTAIEAGAQKNQNAFAKVQHDEDAETAITAADPSDTIIFAGGNHISITTDADSKTVTISSTHPDAVLASDSQNGMMSSSDYTKLQGIESGAQKNTINEIDVNTEKVEPDETGKVDLTIPKKTSELENDALFQKKSEVDNAIKQAIAGAYVYKGSVESADELTTQEETATKGDVYNIQTASDYGPAGMNVAWDGSAWDALGSSISMEAMTASEIQEICTMGE